MTSYTLCLYAQCVMVQSPIAEDYVLLLMFNYHFFITKNPQLVGGFNPSETHRCQLKFYHPISRVEPLVTSPVYSYVSCFFFPLENNNLRNRMKNVLDLGLDPETFAPDCAGPVLLPPGGSDQGSNEKPDRITQIILVCG